MRNRTFVAHRCPRSRRRISIQQLNRRLDFFLFELLERIPHEIYSIVIMLEDVIGTHNLAFYILHISFGYQSSTAKVVALEDLLEDHL